MSEIREGLKKILRSWVHTGECCRDEQEEMHGEGWPWAGKQICEVTRMTTNEKLWDQRFRGHRYGYPQAWDPAGRLISEQFCRGQEFIRITNQHFYLPTNLLTQGWKV